MRAVVRLALPAVTLALAACENAATAPTAVAGPRRAVEFRAADRQIPLTPLNICNGEELVGTGDERFTVSDVSDSAGGVHDAIRDQITNIKLTGTSGASYVGSDVNTIVSNYNAGGAQTFLMKGSSRLVGQGRAPNLVYSFDLHITTNPDGSITSLIDNQTVDCR